MNDTVFIRDLQVETRIGAFAWERQIRQRISIDLEMSCDIRPAAASDDLADALDYKKVAKAVMAHAEQAEYELVETLAEALARIVIIELGVPELVMSLNKVGAVRGARDVGIRIRRRTADYDATGAG